MRKRDLAVGGTYERRHDAGAGFYIYVGTGRILAGINTNKLSVHIPDGVHDVNGWAGRRPGQPIPAVPLLGWAGDFPDDAEALVFVEVSGPRHLKAIRLNYIHVARTVRELSPAAAYDVAQARNIARITIERTLKEWPNHRFAVTASLDHLAPNDVPQIGLELDVDEPVRVVELGDSYADCVGVETGKDYRIDIRDLWPDFGYVRAHRARRVAEVTRGADQRIGALLRSFHDDQGYHRHIATPTADTDGLTLSWPLLLKLLDGTTESVGVVLKMAEAAAEIASASADVGAAHRRAAT